jgi:hypothetical protein
LEALTDRLQWAEEFWTVVESMLSIVAVRLDGSGEIRGSTRDWTISVTWNPCGAEGTVRLLPFLHDRTASGLPSGDEFAVSLDVSPHAAANYAGWVINGFEHQSAAPVRPDPSMESLQQNTVD